MTERPEGAYYFDDESELWVTNNIHDKQHFNWWLSEKWMIDDFDQRIQEEQDVITYTYAAEYLSSG